MKNSMKREQKIEEEEFRCSYIRCNFCLVILFQILFITLIGVHFQFENVNGEDIQFILVNGLAILGFGLLLIQYTNTLKQVFITILLTFALNIEVWPLFSTFWQEVVNGVLHIRDDAQTPINFLTIQPSAYVTLSMLLSLWGAIGRMGVISLNLCIILFHIGFSLNYFACEKIFADAELFGVFNDDFQVSRIFAFGSGFGIMLMLFRRCVSVLSYSVEKQEKNQFQGILSLVGITFIIPLFSYIQNPTQNSSLGSLNIYFAFSASIIGSVASATINKASIGIGDITLALLSGVIQIGVIGKFITFPYISLTIGFVSSMITSFLYNRLYQPLRKCQFSEANGPLFILLVNTLLGIFVVSPIILLSYQLYEQCTICNPTQHMLYGATSLGIGIGFGLIGGFAEMFIAQRKTYEDDQFFHQSKSIEALPQNKGEEEDMKPRRNERQQRMTPYEQNQSSTEEISSDF